jgi:hypothetical protein
MSLIRANQNVFYGFCYDARADPIVAPSDAAVEAVFPEAAQPSGIPWNHSAFCVLSARYTVRQPAYQA